MECGSGYTKTYKGKVYGPYNYKRLPHKFTVVDIARISKSLVKEKRASPIEIVAVIATAVGLGMLICKAAKVYKRAEHFGSFIGTTLLSAAVGWGIKALLQYLLRKPFLTFPLIDRVMYVVIAVLFFIYKVHEALLHFMEDILFVKEISDILETGCDFVKKYTIDSSIFDDVDLSELTDDLPDFDFNDLSEFGDFNTSDLMDRFNNIGDIFTDS